MTTTNKDDGILEEDQFDEYWDRRSAENKIYFALNRGDRHLIVDRQLLYSRMEDDLSKREIDEVLVSLKKSGRITEDQQHILRWVKGCSMLEQLYP